jgi:acid phosphatase class B
MRPLYIFDLDGTLSDATHRRHFVENGNTQWDEFYLASQFDPPKRAIIQIMDTLYSSGADIYIFSGRSDIVRSQTEDWLDKNCQFIYPLINLRMRKHWDHTPDDKLKRQWYDELPDHDKERLVAVFDDRDRIVKMWRELGITCLQVAPGDF